MNHLIMHFPRIPSNKYVKLQAKYFLVISNNLMAIICFDYQLTPTKKLITKANTSWIPFGIQKSIVNFTKVDRTYNLLIFSIEHDNKYYENYLFELGNEFLDIVIEC